MNARQLKNSLLQQAVEGRLVPQNPDDEPAAALLQRIRTEKARLIKEGKIKKQKPLPPITDEEKPFPIPASWEWVRLGEVTLNIHYGFTASAAVTGNVKLLRITDIQNDIVNWDAVPFCTATENQVSTFILKENDILIARTGGTIGKSYLIVGNIPKAVFASYLIRVIPNTMLLPLYIKYFLGSPLYWAQLNSMSMGTGQPNVNSLALSRLLLPLPPLEEQKRIVAKLEELLPEVEEYGRAQEELSALETALPGRLRKSLLQEAVEGRLVPQNPDDEPAAALLQRIRAEKARLIREGKIKKQKPLPPITDEEKPFPIPASWEWVRLGEVILENVGGGTPDKLNSKYWGGSIPWASVKDLHTDRLDETQDYITEEGLQNSATRLLKKGTIIICTRMALGKIVIANIDVAINQDLRGITLSSLFDKDFFMYLYRTLSLEGSGVTVKGIRIENLHNKLIPLPPLEEQKRIVAKLEELLPLCVWGEGETSEPPAGQGEASSGQGEAAAAAEGE